MSRILVVDDSQTVLGFLRAILEHEKHEVVTAIDGSDGLVKVHEVRPDLVITDSIMPGLDGFSFLQALSTDPATESIPVIMLTSADPDDPEFVDRRPQPAAFVKKSADFGPLLAEVRAALERLP